MASPAFRRDLLAGLVFVGIGAAFGRAAIGYPLGTAFRMGPGYFPMLLSGALVLLGLAIIAKGFSPAAAEGPSRGPLPWRGILLLSAALVFFALTVRGLGLAPTLFGTTLLAGAASRENGPLDLLLLAAGLTALCVAIFSYGLGVTVPVLGPWLPTGG